MTRSFGLTSATGRETTALTAGVAAHRTARSWNRCVDAIQGWPQQRLLNLICLTEEQARGHAFPEGLRSDLDAYLAAHVTPHGQGQADQTLQALYPRTWRAELEAFA